MMFSISIELRRQIFRFCKLTSINKEITFLLTTKYQKKKKIEKLFGLIPKGYKYLIH